MVVSPYGDDDEDQEEVPEDLADLPPEEQQKKIIFRASWMMAAGTIHGYVQDPISEEEFRGWFEGSSQRALGGPLGLEGAEAVAVEATQPRVCLARSLAPNTWPHT